MNPLVTPAWLNSRLLDHTTVVLDATLPPAGVATPPDVRARYLERHIPGAVFFDIDELSDHTTGLPHMLPAPELFARSMAALGVSDGDTIVVYEQEGVYSAPRAWWMLRVFGAREVYLLDGGLRAWCEAGLPVESGAVPRPTGIFHARLQPGAVKNFVDVQQIIAGGGQILDARSEGRFRGTAPEPRPGIRSGHMPGSISVPFPEVAEQGKMKSADELRTLFGEKGVDLARPITTSCGSGVTAAVISLALEIAGARQTSLYDGSWAEYAQRPEAVIEAEE